ncbi:MAG: flavodoxin family protein [Promethearchaeota archaeon]
MELNVLGISGSPVKEGNTEAFLQHMLDITSKEGLKNEGIHLSKLNIKDCIHCNFCLRKQQPGKYCSIDDDSQEIFEKVEQVDILVLVSPVYFMRTSARMAAFIDRLRVFMYGNLVGGKLKNKIGVSAAVSWLRNGGLETTHLSHIYAFMTLEMIPVSAYNSVSPLGASTVASLHGSGKFDKAIKLGINQDKSGLYSLTAIMKRAIELANIINGRP